jgi:hypothetical protein
MIKLNKIVPLYLILIIFSGCKPTTSGEQEINKLLDRQAKLQESQDESLDKLQQLKDSIALNKNSLLAERDLKDQQILQLEENQRMLADQLKEKEQNAAASVKYQLHKSISLYEDSIEQLKSELARLNDDLDSIETSMELYQMQEKQADEILESGINEIDQQINRLEKQKHQEIRKADLLKRRIRIVEEKIEAFTLERQMYADEREDLLSVRSSPEQIEPLILKINELDSIIRIQKTQKRTLASERDQTLQWITEVDSLVEDLQIKIKQEYDRNQIIVGFIAAEKQRLGKAMERLARSRQDLISEQAMISKDLADTEAKIASLNKRLELIKNREMSDILKQQADIERSDAALAEAEIRLLEESAELNKQSMKISSDNLSDELHSLQQLSNQLDSLKILISEEKTEITKARLELSRKKAQAAKKRSRSGRTLGTITMVLILGGLGLLTFFYYLGRRARKS